MRVEEAIKKILLEALKELATTYTPVETTSEIMTRDQLAAYLQISKSWIDQNMKIIPHLKVCGTKFRKCDIDKWLDENVITNDKFSNISKVTRKKSACRVI